MTPGADPWTVIWAGLRRASSANGNGKAPQWLLWERRLDALRRHLDKED